LKAKFLTLVLTDDKVTQSSVAGMQQISFSGRYRQQQPKMAAVQSTAEKNIHSLMFCFVISLGFGDFR
jgi:hypothetical protein